MTADVAALASDNLEIWTGAIERKSEAGRGNVKRLSLHGIDRLRSLILDMAVRGKLVPQHAADEPALGLLGKIEEERTERIRAGEIRATAARRTVGREPFALPETWLWLPVSQTGNIFSGTSVNASTRSRLAENRDGVPFVATKDIGYGLDPIVYDNGLLVSRDDRSFKFAKPKAIYICAEGGSAGKKIAISDREIAFGNKLIANETWSVIDPKFALYVYLSDYFYRCFSDEMTGIIGGIPLSKFLALPFPLPPLPEQRRIVAKVDELMALCDALERESAGAMAAHQTLVETLLLTLTNSADFADLTVTWERLEAHFDILFTSEASVDALGQAILDLAVRGKLVQQDPNDEPATALIARLNKSKAAKEYDTAHVSEAFECPSGWQWTNVKSLLGRWRDISYGIIKLGPEPKSGGIPTLRCSDVRPGRIDLFGVRTVDEEIEKDFARTRLKGGEVLINIRGTLGGVALVGNELAGYNVAREVAVIPISEELSGQFIVYLMLSTYFWNHIESNLRGIAYKGLNLGILRDLPVPLPPVAEQRRIVAKVDGLMALCQQLKSNIADAARTKCKLADVIVERLAA